MYTIVVVFTLLSGGQGTAHFNRTPPILNLDDCKLAIPLMEQNVRDAMAQHNKTVRDMTSRCVLGGDDI